MGRYKSLGSLISFLWHEHQLSGASILCFHILSFFKAQHWERLQSDAYLLLFSRSVMSSSFWSHGLQNTRLPCPSPSPGVCSNSGQWCYPTISSSIVSFFCLLSFPASGFFFFPQWISSSHQVAKVLELQLQHQSFQWIFGVDFL